MKPEGETVPSIVLGLGGLSPSEFDQAVNKMDLADLLIYIRTANVALLRRQIREADEKALSELKNEGL